MESFSPGLRGTSYPGSGVENQINPERVESKGVRWIAIGGARTGLPAKVEGVLAPLDGREMDATLSELMALIPRPTQGSPAPRGNPGLDDAIPSGLRRTARRTQRRWGPKVEFEIGPRLSWHGFLNSMAVPLIPLPAPFTFPVHQRGERAGRGAMRIPTYHDLCTNFRPSRGPRWLVLAGALALAHCAQAQVFLSEILYHPVEQAAFDANGAPLLDLSSDVYEFVELHNASASAVPLDGWRLSGGISFDLP